MKKNARGIFLVFCTFILAILSLLAIFLYQTASLDQGACANHSSHLQAQMIAYAGMDYCSTRLLYSSRQIIQPNYVFTDWRSLDIPGQPLENLLTPSYGSNLLMVGEKQYHYTGMIAKNNFPSGNYGIYICRVTDNASKININSTCNEILAKTLSVLFTCLNVTDISQAILLNRGESGYFSLEDMRQKLALDAETYSRIKPYLCTQGVQEMLFDPLTKTRLPYYPVNINTASPEVLTALFTGIAGETTYVPQPFTILYEKAHSLALLIHERAKVTPFLTWQQFGDYLKTLIQFTPQEISLVFANACPLVLSNSINPDEHVVWAIDRLHLTSYTIPCTLGPSGIFTIESLGILLDGSTILEKQEIESEMQIFHQVIHNTQKDFYAIGPKPAYNTNLVYAVTGPVSMLPYSSGLPENPAAPNGLPDPNMGFFIRGNGNNREGAYYQDTASNPSFSGNYCDGTGDAISMECFPENSPGNPNIQSFFFKPGPFFDATVPTTISRNFSFIHPQGLGICTEILYDPILGISASRSLSVVEEIAGLPGSSCTMKSLEGIIRPEGFDELMKIGAEIYQENLETRGAMAAFYYYMETGSKSHIGTFAFNFAKHICMAMAEGRDEVEVAMPFLGLHFAVTPVTIPPIPYPMYIPILVEKEETKKILEFNATEYYDIVFQPNLKITEITKIPERGCVRNIGLIHIPPFDHPFPVSRTEFVAKPVAPLQQGKWYRISIIWDGIEIKKMVLIEDARAILGQEVMDSRENPLRFWRVIDSSVVEGSQFLASGTYLSADKMDFLRYKNSYLQNTFIMPIMTNPEFAHILVNAFTPTGCQVSVDSCSLETGYNILLTGNPYLTPVIPEIRIRVLHRVKYLSF